MIAASAALTISGVPFMGPIGAARVGFVERRLCAEPVDGRHARTCACNPDQRLDLVIAGTKDAVMMVESEAYELTEDEMLGAVKFGHAAMQPVIDLIIDFAEDCAKEPFDFQRARLFGALCQGEEAAGETQMRAAFAIRDKQERTNAIDAAVDAIKAALSRRRSGRHQPRLGDQEAGMLDPARRHHQRRRPHRRPRHQDRAPDRLRKPASCRAPTARRCSPVAKRRLWS